MGSASPSKERQRICEHLKTTTLSFIQLVWLHQPYLEAGSRLLLESMLLETGHRAL